MEGHGAGAGGRRPVARRRHRKDEGSHAAADFETIIAEINPEINAKLTTFEDAAEDVKDKRSDVHVVVAEDSPMSRDLLVTIAARVRLSLRARFR